MDVLQERGEEWGAAASIRCIGHAPHAAAVRAPALRSNCQAAACASVRVLLLRSGICFACLLLSAQARDAYHSRPPPPRACLHQILASSVAFGVIPAMHWATVPTCDDECFWSFVACMSKMFASYGIGEGRDFMHCLCFAGYTM